MKDTNKVLEDEKYILYDDGVSIKEATLNKEEARILNYAYALNGAMKRWKLDEQVRGFKYFR